MTGERESRSLPVLLGMGLSLAVLILVVNRSEAANRCDLCDRNQLNRAWQECGEKGGVGSCYYVKYHQYRQVECYDTGICPDSDTYTGEKNCGDAGCRADGSVDPALLEQTCGKNADPQSGAVCHNDYWGRPCAGDSTRCRDVQVKSSKVWSLCHTKCGCSQ